MVSKTHVLRMCALWMIALVLSMPVYSAQALAASLQVQRNSGTDTVGGFVDAAGDTWTLQVLAQLDAGEQVTRENVRVNGVPFGKCENQQGLGQVCTYELSQPEGFSGEGARTVRLELRKQGGQVVDTEETKVTLDGSEPVVTVRAVQEGRGATITYTVRDQPSACVGLQKIVFKHGTTVVKTIEGTDLTDISDGACGTGTIREVSDVEVVPISVSSTGTQRIEVVAVDRLGHEGKAIVAFAFDGVAPVVMADTLAVGAGGSFVAPGKARTKVSVELVEDGNDVEAVLKVGGTSFDGVCVGTGSEGSKTVFTCTWNDIEIDFGGTFTAAVEASDGHNTVTKQLTKQFSLDTVKPVLQRFGVEHPEAGINFVKRSDNVFVAVFTEAESGIDAEDVLADFHEITAREGSVAADECTKSGSTWTCRWESIGAERASADRTATVTLTEVTDIVGNPATLGQASIVQRDDVAPVVSNVRAVVQGGARSFIQSRDELLISFEVVEAHGVRAAIDTSQIIADTKTQDAECVVKDATTLICSVTTAPIDSFDGRTVTVPLLVFDGAGNQAKNAENTIPALQVTVFGTDDDLVDPNFWSVRGAVTLLPESLDASVTKLIPQRVFASVGLVGDVTLVDARATCIGDHVLRSFMINDFRPEGKPTIVVEFEPFDPLEEGSEVAEIEVTCALTLQSRRGNVVVQQAEEEEVKFPVKFFLTEFDNDLSTIEEEIDDAKEDASVGLLKIIGTLNEILEWAKIICNIISLVDTLLNAVQALNPPAEALQRTPLTFAVGVGLCEAKGAVGGSAAFGIETLQTICALVTCTGQSKDGQVETGTLSKTIINLRAHQKRVLDGYNNWFLGGTGFNWAAAQDASGKPSAFGEGVANFAKANSLYDNVWLSVAGICLPGIIYNIEKYRQIQCRYASCLENEVKGGVATIEACRELKDYQLCKYFTGELFQLVPFINAIDNLLGLLKSLLTDPIGILRAAAIYSCQAAWCGESASAEGVCEYVAYIVFLTDFVNSIISTVQQIDTKTSKDYCETVGL
ncbi:MAG TPA: hypothetical protein VJH88_03215 [Candidatus Nanoarchaeia archaeon]|nr:hypothetical protein [Candidatus Nanoarchaeia archaeon]